MGRTKGGLNTKLAAVADGVGGAVGLNLRLFIGKWGHGARNGLPCPR